MQSKNIRIRTWYRQHMEKMVPLYAFMSLVFCFVWNCIVYWSTQFLGKELYHYNFTTSFDQNIPLVSAWVSIYILSFVFWVVNFSVIAKNSNKEYWFRFVFGDVLSRVICGAIFLLIPTTLTRPELESTGFWNSVLYLIYTLDMPVNLFPSIHCLASVMSSIGLRGCRNIPKAYKAFSWIFALLICASTLFTHQHYIIDVIGGVLLAILCYALGQHTSWYKGLKDVFCSINERMFGCDDENQENCF